MNDISIAFIGGGNMAGSLIGGLIADGYPRELLRVSDADTESCVSSVSASVSVHALQIPKPLPGPPSSSWP
jgi:pyrroline-5-carboxylate reductase